MVPVLKKTARSQERGKTSRNIEVATFKVNPGPGNKENEPRPQTAPQSIYRWVVLVVVVVVVMVVM